MNSLTTSILTVGILLSLGMTAQADGNPVELSSLPPGSTDHKIFLQGTDHELHVYTVVGKESGNTIMIIGGIHGNEPGAYIAADKYVDLALRRGNLIIVPRANLDSILSNDRGSGGDYNRKFASKLDEESVHDQVIAVLKSLMQQSDLVLNLHDGSGFYRDEWLDKWHNPYRFGQSIIADAAYYEEGRNGPINLEDIGRRIVEAINSKIEDQRYHFTFANHDSISSKTRYPEMRKTATYYALTQHKIPAFGLEVSKSLPTTEMKVEHQVLAINAFLDEYDVIVDVPPARIEEPRLDYLVINVNDSDPLIVKNGGTLYVEKGARVSVDHIVGNYERYLFADFVGVGDRNDNDLEVAVSAPVTIKVRKDAMICGEVTILPRSAENRALHELKGARTENFIIEINGISQLIAGSSSIEAVIGDKIKVIDFISPHDPRGINVNFKGFVGNPDNNRGEDRGYVADTSRDLLKDWSIDGEGLRYTIVAKRGTRELSKITLNLLKPRLEYVVLRLGNQQPVVVMNDKEFLINGEGDLRIIDVRTNAERQRDISYHLSGIEGEVILPVDGAYEIERLRLQDGIRYPLKVYKGNTLMGGIFLKLAKGR